MNSKNTLISIIILLLLTMTSYVQAMSWEDARHLLNRTGYGGTYEEIKYFTTLDWEQAVDEILNQKLVINYPPPENIFKPLVRGKVLKSLPTEMKIEKLKERRERAFELKTWWYQRMLETPNPLQERMTLFWHNHFTSSLSKAPPMLMYRQNELFRQYALGNFSDLLHAVIIDPALMFYLDAHKNTKQHPNENLARELLELFTLGEGNYTETDVKEVARSLTGFRVYRDSGKVKKIKSKHDNGTKTFLGRTGNFDHTQIINIILKDPKVSLHLARKLHKEFVSLEPDQHFIEQIAKQIRNNNYNLKPVLHFIFNHSKFKSLNNHATLIKSPIELLVGFSRQLEIPVKSINNLPIKLKLLKQNIFNPPNVKGWPGGTEWINGNLLLKRQHLINGLSLEEPEKPSMKIRLNYRDQFLLKYEIEEMLETLLPTTPVYEINRDSKRFAYNKIINDLTFQLK